jgi:hypothetical protein
MTLRKQKFIMIGGLACEAIWVLTMTASMSYVSALLLFPVVTISCIGLAVFSYNGKLGWKLSFAGYFLIWVATLFAILLPNPDPYLSFRPLRLNNSGLMILVRFSALVLFVAIIIRLATSGILRALSTKT